MTRDNCSEADLCTAYDWYNDGYCDPCQLLGGTADPDCEASCGFDTVCMNYFESDHHVWLCDDLGFTDPDCGTCGNGAIEGFEDCDTDNLNGWTCEELNFVGGTITCRIDCALDYNGCIAE